MFFASSRSKHIQPIKFIVEFVFSSQDRFLLSGFSRSVALKKIEKQNK